MKTRSWFETFTPADCLLQAGTIAPDGKVKAESRKQKAESGKRKAESGKRKAERDHEYESVQQLKGSLSQKNCPAPSEFERAQYMRAISNYSLPPLIPAFGKTGK